MNIVSGPIQNGVQKVGVVLESIYNGIAPIMSACLICAIYLSPLASFVQMHDTYTYNAVYHIHVSTNFK